MAQVIILCAALFDWLAFRFPRLDRLLKPRRLLLVENGELK